MTGATHARELISTSLNVYEMLKLLKHGAIEKDPHFEKLLNQNRYFFLPILNVDGVSMIEETWNKTHKIIPHRKNHDKEMSSNCPHPDEDIGVDLNRNFGIDFG
jgi:murein tripeptide amidase MpaA